MQSFGENNFMPLGYVYERSLFIFVSFLHTTIVFCRASLTAYLGISLFISPLAIFAVPAIMQCSALMVWIQKNFFFSYRDHKIP